MTNYFDWPTNEPNAQPGADDQPEQDSVEPPIYTGEQGTVSASDPAAEALSSLLADAPREHRDDPAGGEEVEVDALEPMIKMVAAMMAANEGELPSSSEATAAPAASEEPVLATSFSGIEGRLAVLSKAILKHPDSPANYILRGDAYLEAGKRADAVRDYLAALRLAQDRQTDWEYLNRSFIDRARQGLRRSGYNHHQ